MSPSLAKLHRVDLPHLKKEFDEMFNLAASIASDEDQKRFAENRDEHAGKMSPAKIAEAQKLARAWKPITKQ